MRIAWRILLVMIAAATGIAVMPPSANALSCTSPDGVADLATHTFTGRIQDAKAHRIQVEVEEIWSGGPLQKQLWLDTELDGWWDGMKNGHLPDGYHSKTTWLFMSRTDDRGQQVVGPCSAWPTTKPWGTDLRPASVMAPISPEAATNPPTVSAATATVAQHDAEDGPNLLVRSGAAALVVGALGAVVLLVRRRRKV